MAETYPINIWINEKRFNALQKAGLEKLLKEELAGMKVLVVPCTAAQRDKVLKLFPMAKYDAATTKSIAFAQEGEGQDLQFGGEKENLECHGRIPQGS